MNIQSELKVFQITSKVLTPLKIYRLKFSVVSGILNIFMVQKENQEMPEINRNPFKQENTHCYQLPLLKNC